MRIRTILIIAGVLVAAAAGWRVTHPVNNKPAEEQAGRNGAVPVGIAVAQKGDIDVILSALGTVTPLSEVTIRTQISGQLTGIGFQEGQIVHENDFLAQIDPRPYENALAQAQGQLAKDQALLKDSEVVFGRYQKLFKQDSIARQQLDTQESLVQQHRGEVQSDQAQVEAAKLNLQYCHITAPFAGRVGLRQVDAGNYVQTSAAIVTLAQTQPITVLFTLPEDNVPELVKRMQNGAPIEVTAFDRNQAAKLASGKVSSMDNKIDSATGTVKLRAQFDNEEAILFPNQFVNVKVLLNTLHDVTTIPLTGVQRGVPGTFVYLVMPENTVTVRPVKLGADDGTKVAVTEGLAPDDKIVVDGADKLREGAKVSLPSEQSGAETSGDSQRKSDTSQE
ncbi:MAG: efflux RND transporter periplasmic adaptor subunit [Alphaproteobacteria bacterium]|nr:efflux RND transporter periplasmic adaptor subunit [Alphaproteobacteria bacterium]